MEADWIWRLVCGLGMLTVLPIAMLVAGLLTELFYGGTTVEQEDNDNEWTR